MSNPWKSLTYNITPDGVPEVLVDGKPLPVVIEPITMGPEESALLGRMWEWHEESSRTRVVLGEPLTDDGCDDEYFAAMAMPEGVDDD